MDKNSDGRVTEAEWLEWNKSNAEQKDESYTSDKLKDDFSTYDIDGDKALSQEEFKEIRSR